MPRDITNPKTAETITVPFNTDFEALDIARKIKGNSFAESLVSQFDTSPNGLSVVQWFYVNRVAAEHLDKLEGNGVSEKYGEDLGAHAYDSIAALFFSAYASGLKYPKVRFDTPSGEVVLSMSSKRSKVPGSLNVLSKGSYDERKWYGRITDDNWFHTSKACKPEIVEHVKEFASDPIKYATAYGHRTGNCCFCGIELTHGSSIKVGYGPVCADHWGLPHNYDNTESVEELSVFQTPHAKGTKR